MLEDFYRIEPYSLDKKVKEELLTKELIELTEHHRRKCLVYKNITDALNYNKENIKSYYDLPFFPVRMFKERDLISIDKADVFKVMTSSGTTGQAVSKIYLDKGTAMAQQKVMLKILEDFIGKQRLPMLIIDTPNVIKNKDLFSARGAAIIGLRFMSREMVYALNKDMGLNIEVVEDFLNRNGQRPFLIFGFTFMVWMHLLMEARYLGKEWDMSNGILFTGGGWKKLETEAISREKFKESFKETLGINRFLDHYGMVEQTGCIYAECECGHLHASNYSDVIVRRYEDFSVCDIGEKGLIQVVSVIPGSYPGHSLITEDEGIVLGEDNCPCGRKGKYVKILGRIKSAELRGCSDTYAVRYR